MFGPSQRVGNSTFFYGLVAVDVAWIPYKISDQAVMLSIIAVGGGASGAGGFGAAANTARGGGGGGGAGALSRLLVPTMFLPKEIFVQPGYGGQFSGGNVTYVSIAPNSTQANLILTSFGGSSAGTGTATGGGGGGAGATVPSGAFIPPYSALGVYTPLAGMGGASGGAHTGAVGGTITFGGSGTFYTGGAGGAGCTTTTFAGGPITGGGIMPTVAGGAASTVGDPGLAIWSPLTFCGGSGAGSSNTVAGSVGGKAGYGSGGGGGGAGVTTGGSGGDGGAGFVIITEIF